MLFFGHRISTAIQRALPRCAFHILNCFCQYTRQTQKLQGNFAVTDPFHQLLSFKKIIICLITILYYSTFFQKMQVPPLIDGRFDKKGKISFLTFQKHFAKRSITNKSYT